METRSRGHLLVRALVCAGLAVSCAYEAASLPPDEAAGNEGFARVTRTDLVGTWRNCQKTSTFAEDGTYLRVDVRTGCEARGHWTWHDDDTLELDEGACNGGKSSTLTGVRIDRADQGLLLVHPDFSSGFMRLYSDTVLHERLLLTGQALEGPQGKLGRTVLRRIGVPGSGGVGCYWAEDLQCGGILSCSGNVYGWDETPERVRASLACTGDCPCGSTIELRPDGKGGAKGFFNASSCTGIWQGALEAARLEDP